MRYIGIGYRRIENSNPPTLAGINDPIHSLGAARAFLLLLGRQQPTPIIHRRPGNKSCSLRISSLPRVCLTESPRVRLFVSPGLVATPPKLAPCSCRLPSAMDATRRSGMLARAHATTVFVPLRAVT
jgi:hypothetical protein